jgi:serpin B
MHTLSRRHFLIGAGLMTLSGMLMNCGIGQRSVALAEARSSLARQSVPLPEGSDLDSFIIGRTWFAFDSFQQLRGSGNLFFSPYSIMQALLMVMAGAEGETLAEIAHVVHADRMPDAMHAAANALDKTLMDRATQKDGFKLSLVNTMWGQHDFTFQPMFLDTLAQHYGTGIRLIDFSGAPETARQTINAEIAKQTNDLIRDLLPPPSITSDTRFVLTNAIYFNAKWLVPFPKERTEDGTFTTADNRSVTVPMMRQVTRSYQYAKGPDYQAIELPYIGDMSLVAIMPDAGQLDAFEASLDGDRFQEIVSRLAWQEVRLTMPKFTFTSDSISLKEMLSALGMPSAFLPTANFSAMTSQARLMLGDVYHKAMVRLDEEGTEAAAASAAIGMPTSAPMEEPIELVLDRPFVFAIRDNVSGEVLFLGRLADPIS